MCLGSGGSSSPTGSVVGVGYAPAPVKRLLLLLAAVLAACGGTTVLLHDDKGYERYTAYRGEDAAYLYLVNIDMMPKSPWGTEDSGTSFVQIDRIRTQGARRWSHSSYVYPATPGEPAVLRHRVYSALRLAPGEHRIRLQGHSIRRLGAKNPTYDPSVNKDSYTEIFSQTVPMQAREVWAIVAFWEPGGDWGFFMQKLGLRGEVRHAARPAAGTTMRVEGKTLPAAFTQEWWAMREKIAEDANWKPGPTG